MNDVIFALLHSQMVIALQKARNHCIVFTILRQPDHFARNQAILYCQCHSMTQQI